MEGLHGRQLKIRSPSFRAVPALDLEDPDLVKMTLSVVESFLGETAHLQAPLSRGSVLSKHLTPFHL